MEQRVRRRVKALRSELGLTQEETATRAGISRGYYASIERGRRNISFGVLKGVAKALSVSLVSFLADENPVEATQRIEHTRAVRFARLLERIDGDGLDVVEQVMERFARSVT